MQKENQANLALALSVVGAIGTMGQSGGILLTTVHHGFLAATIGGIADWFAVKAIFGRPLGISHRTDILRRNRTRIMDALVSFSSDDLLSRENIMYVVEQEQIGALLIEYLEHRGGRGRLVDAAAQILRYIASDVDSRHVAGELAPYILRRMIWTQAFQELLNENIVTIRTEYERDGMIRAFILSFFDDDVIARWLTTKFDELLQSSLDTVHRRHIDGVASLGAFISSIRSDAAFHNVLYRYKMRFIENLDIESMIVDFIETRIKGSHPFWVPYVKELLNDKIDHFVSSEGWQNRADRWVKALVSAELDKHHDLIAVFVREYLSQKTDDELIAFLERKINTDLQMIRINGAVVGAFVGMGLSLLVSLAERMWGL